MSARPPVHGTATTLSRGTMVSAALFGSSLVAAAAQLNEASRLLGLGGVLVLLATPALGLVVTAVELRQLQPRASFLALVVLGVLAVAAAVAVLSR